MKTIVFIDLEVNQKDQVVNYGAFVDEKRFFQGNKKGFIKFIKGYDYICGHNSFSHDFKYIDNEVKKAGIRKRIDTLPLSALLFANHPYHNLVKDYKLDKNEENDPYVDAKLTHTLFIDEVYKFNTLDENLKDIYYELLNESDSFKWFFKYLDYNSIHTNVEQIIQKHFRQNICSIINLKDIIINYPEELAYCLAVIDAKEKISNPPEWIIHQYPKYMEIMTQLRGVPCFQCEYCNTHYDTKQFLFNTFGYENYRTFNGQNLQEEAVNSQIRGESIITVFPTAGGKSIAFQVPALIMGETVKGLTIVISPLQSLMQDQVENLRTKNINNVGTINGAMNAIERKNTIENVRNGFINLLYIAPESLRSPSIYSLLVKRNIVRFVIDEAHCFSTWGHDFRVDYLYIGEFIKNIIDSTNKNKKIPVSCFTATAKKEVIDDISQYFKEQLGIVMKIINTDTRRKNLHFYVHDCKNHKEKMMFIRDLLENSEPKPTIIYASRRKTAELVASELNQSGFPSLYYHGGLKSEIKNTHQLAFTQGEKNIIVATSAFGMGVDKDNVSYVIHYNVSSTIEDYIQEAGRAGRDKSIQAECHILYNEEDVDEHFNLMTSQKLSQTDINQVWKTIKRETKNNNEISISISELARRSGWEINRGMDTSTKITNSVLALEKVGYIKRGQNAARVYASNIIPKTMIEARKKIDNIQFLDDEDRMNLHRIMTRFFTDKTTSPSRGQKPISMIDDLVEELEITKRDTIRLIYILKDNKIIDYENDIFAKKPFEYTKRKSKRSIERLIRILRKLICVISENKKHYHIKELHTIIKDEIADSDLKTMNIALNFLIATKIVKQHKEDFNSIHKTLSLLLDIDDANQFIDSIADLSDFVIDYTYDKLEEDNNKENNSVSYSVIELKREYINRQTLFQKTTSIEEIENTLLFIIRSGALIIDGGFLVIYNPMRITKIEQNPLKQYTQEDYRFFLDYYNNKIKKVHILTHFVRTLSVQPEKGLELVDDYFNLNYKVFEKKYITSDYVKYLSKPMTKTRYEKLFKKLSLKQRQIIDDDSGKNIVVLAGPGSGKTMLLAHKLASLIQLEDVKAEELLMLTFSRAATIVFKERLKKLIGGKANYVAIKTFHSFCFDVIGEVGNLDKTEDLFKKSTIMIEEGQVEEYIINKTTLVIDEAQDMSEGEYNIIQALIKHNENMRIIAVGDDDQNIYKFRGSDSKYLNELTKNNCTVYELLTNYRSKNNLVEFTQGFVQHLSNRLKNEICDSNDKLDGNIRVYKYNCENLFIPIIEQVGSLNNRISVAILTHTNEDAEIMASLLSDKGINTRLIQSNSSFSLINLYEIRHFLALFSADIVEIPKEMWAEYVKKLSDEIEGSSLKKNILRLLNGFENLYPNKKYLIDLKIYINESKMEDLYIQEDDLVTISTMHKSKGREFHTVFIMQNKILCSQEEIRTIYVGLTRAEVNLIVHTNSNLFDDLDYIKEISEIYDKPNQLILQTEYSDINLGSSKYCQNSLLYVFTDSILDVDVQGCKYNEKQVVYFSKKMQKKISDRINEGYVLVDAKVTFKVTWYNEEENKEYWIVLPKITLCKIAEKLEEII